MMTTSRPTEQHAREAAAKFLGHEDFTTRRYSNGMCHYVYEVTPGCGPKIVVRLGHDETREHLRGSVFWDQELRSLNLPTPRIVYHDLQAVFPYTILEHLQGADLVDVFSTLAPTARARIARDVAAMQDRVAQLPRAKGFGYGYSYSDARLTSTWRAVLDEQLDRARAWIRGVGVASEAHVDRVIRALLPLGGYLDDVEPGAFLHDTTTKNVMVNESGLVGVVDIDDMCFGDRLYVLSLTNMALFSMKADRDYITVWSDAWNLNETQRRVVSLYTAVNCVGFIGEIGQRFNRDTAEVDYGRLRYLEGVLEHLLA